MNATESEKMIISIALLILRQEELLTMEKIRNTVHKVTEMLRGMNRFSGMENVVEDRIIREIETLYDVYVPTMSILDDMHNHPE
jgi:hypothetical protein